MSALELRSGHKLLGWITCWVGVSGGVSVFLMSAFELQSGHKLFRVDQMLGCWFGQRVFLMSAFELRSGHRLDHMLGWCVGHCQSVFLMSAFELQSGHKLFRVDQMLDCWFKRRVL